MPTKKSLSEHFKDRFSQVAERSRIMAQALKVRADIANARRRLRQAHADIGVEIHRRLALGEELRADEQLAALCAKVDGIKAEIKLFEHELRQILRPSPSFAPSPEAAEDGDEIEDAAGEMPERPSI